jgi:class 3 adenylate cyclase/tetratricopeptide (TPR) repeat protein
MTDRDHLERAIRGLEAQRGALGDEVVDAAIRPLAEKLRRMSLPPGSRRRRKRVTILFADIQGYTRMAESMDPEQLDELMSEVWGRLDREITGRGGRIDKHMGDAVMAVWGGEQAREDDAARAVRAALAMQGALADLGSAKVGLRVGINTGLVLMTEVGANREETAVGDAVNVAQRLETAAPVGGVLISHDTYAQVGSLFEVEPQEPLSVAGKVEPLSAYVVIGERARDAPRATTEGVEVRLVGRERELAVMQVAIEEAFAGEGLRWLLLVGEAGIGKSRLIGDLERSIAPRAAQLAWFRGRASEATRQVPYALIRDLLATRSRILDSDSPREVRDKLFADLSGQLGQEGELATHAIAAFLGFDIADGGPSPSGVPRNTDLRDSALAHLGEYFQAAAAAVPCVLLLEDLHWADQGSLSVVEHLIRVLGHDRVLVVSSARPSVFEDRPRFGSGLPLTRLHLAPLDRAESAALVDAILEPLGTVPEALRELIVGRAEGNPFYVEELIKKLVQDGVIVADPEGWYVAPTRLAEVEIPPTLAGIIEARLDALAPEERIALQRASVFGRVFWDRGVEALVQADGQAIDVEDTLRILARRQLVHESRGSTFTHARELWFGHAIVRDVTYETILLRERKRYHAEVARWLVGKSGVRSTEWAAVVADHWWRAGEPEQALINLLRASDQALASGAPREALDMVDRALACLEALPDPERRQRGELLLRKGAALFQSSDFNASDGCLEEGLEIARESGDARLAAEALIGLAETACARGIYPRAHEALTEALDQAYLASDAARMAHTLVTLGWVSYRLGDFEEAKISFERARDIFDRVGDRRGLALAFTRLGSALSKLGAFAEAASAFDRAVALTRELGARRDLARALNNYADQLWRHGHLEAARRNLDEALPLCEQIHERLGAGIAHLNYGHVASEQGDHEVAFHHYRHALRTFDGIGARPAVLDALAGCALPMAARGNLEGALDLLGFVWSDVSAGEEERFTVQRVLAHLRRTVPEARIQEGLARGPSLACEELVLRALDEPSLA